MTLTPAEKAVLAEFGGNEKDLPELEMVLRLTREIVRMRGNGPHTVITLVREGMHPEESFVRVGAVVDLETFPYTSGDWKVARIERFPNG